MAFPTDPLALTRQRRRHRNDEPPDTARSRFQRDRDRLLYSSFFRRLSGVTQVVSPTELHFVHNRLTHTLEVAQLSRRLAERLLLTPAQRATATVVGGIDPDAAEAAALCHDLGHPPFGHIVESELDRLALEGSGNAPGVKKRGALPEGFNGNAQSFRIVTKLSVRRQGTLGLDLTRATLDGSLKYPTDRRTAGEDSTKWGYYATEKIDYTFTRPEADRTARSAEADIVDWADDVAYAVHDLEDFVRAGIIPLDRLSYGSSHSESQRFLSEGLAKVKKDKGYNDQELVQAFDEVFELFTFPDPYRGSMSDRARLRQDTSNLIDIYIKAFSLNDSWSTSDSTAPRSVVDPKFRRQVDLLKRLTWFYVIDTPSLALQQEGHKKITSALYQTYIDAAFAGRAAWGIFPAPYRERLHIIEGGTPQDGIVIDSELSDDQKRVRLVIDLLASMSELQMAETYSRSNGISYRSALEQVGLM